VKFLGSKECQDIVAEAAVVFPAIEESIPAAQAAFEEKGVDVTPFTIHVDEGTTFLFPITDNAADINAIMLPAMDAVMSGQTDVSSLSDAKRGGQHPVRVAG
jgi:multiple sugar transport system substrate-binding protein